MTIAYIIIAVILLVAIYLWAAYNGLIRMKVRTEEAWSDVEVQLKRRYDLIPNLVETVKGYAKHEKTAFESVTKARSEALGAKSIDGKSAAEGALAGALKSVFAIAEAYPDLKANQNFIKMQEDLTDTEDKIQAARRFYNGNVRDLNIAIQSFPRNLIANAFGFQKKELFELQNDEAKEPVKVKFE